MAENEKHDAAMDADKRIQVMYVMFPMTARELETKLHAYCDHHGWDVEVKPVFREVKILGGRHGTIAETGTI